jgi:hypothetical protein
LGSCIGGLSGRRNFKASGLDGASGWDRTEDRLAEEFVVAIEARSEKMSLAVEKIDVALDDSQVVLLNIVSIVEMEFLSAALCFEPGVWVERPYVWDTS